MHCHKCMNEFDEQFGVCPLCGTAADAEAKEPFQLNPGVILHDRYIIGLALGVGGFGITYTAWDMKLSQKVAVKEYYPSANGVVNRSPGSSEVIIYGGDRSIEFEKGKQRFLMEARNMAKFSNHPNIVHVYEFFEANKTAYIVMEYLEGKSFKEFIAESGGRVEVGLATRVILAVLDALKEIHQFGIIHRDISPDNIFISPQGVVKVIDFGAARFSSGDEEKTMSIILKPGYAPPEQYRSKSVQGPWTDVYAVGATFYRCIMGFMPDESVNRVVKDDLEAPHTADPNIPENISNAIMRAMALERELRFKDVQSFAQAIIGEKKVDTPKEVRSKRIRLRMILGAALLAVFGLSLGAVYWIYNSKQNFKLADADISVWLPRSAFRGASDEKKTWKQVEKNFKKEFDDIHIKLKVIDDEDYAKELTEALEDGKGPTIFDSSFIEDAQEYSANLDITYKYLEKNDEMQNYPYLSEYIQEHGKTQLPLSFEIPLIYRNAVKTDAEGEDFVPDMDEILASGDYAVNADHLSAFEKSGYKDIDDQAGLAEFLVDTEAEAEETTADPDAFDAQAQRDAALAGKVSYYLSDTGDYLQIQKEMAGLYGVSVLEGDEVHARYSNVWSINASASKNEKKAADMLIYFALKESAQHYLILQSGSIPMNKKVWGDYMQTYTELNLEDEAQLEEFHPE